MKEHVFVGNVLHNGQAFLKGHLCPEPLHAEMLSKNLIAPLPQAIKPAEPAKAEPVKAEAKAKGEKK